MAKSSNFIKACDEAIVMIQKVNDNPFMGYPPGTLRVLKAKFNEETGVVSVELAYDPQTWSGVWESIPFVDGIGIDYNVINPPEDNPMFVGAI